MNGLYIHIPFCLSRCGYCDFYSTTDNQLQKPFLQALLHEMEGQRDFFHEGSCDTIYLGGGTPSVLHPDDIRMIIDKALSLFDFQNDCQITIEVNPEDLHPDYLKELFQSGVNRFSMGVQAFQDEHLRLMNRRHNVSKAREALTWLADLKSKAGIQVSIDLIYGVPGLSPEQWDDSLKQFINSGFDHLSAYHLSFEKGTPFERKLRAGQLTEMAEEQSWQQYRHLIKTLAAAGFDHYEISNFARNKEYSRHNLKYWSGNAYLGLGPAAHSFNGMERFWNKSNLKAYIEYFGRSDRPHQAFYKSETIDQSMHRNEYVMTRLRTRWGIKKSDFSSLFGEQAWTALHSVALPFALTNDMIISDKGIQFTEMGWFRSDGILADLFI